MYRYLGYNEEALKLVNTALENNKMLKHKKLWLIKAHLLEALDRIEEVRDTFDHAL